MGFEPVLVTWPPLRLARMRCGDPDPAARAFAEKLREEQGSTLKAASRVPKWNTGERDDGPK